MFVLAVGGGGIRVVPPSPVCSSALLNYQLTHGRCFLCDSKVEEFGTSNFVGLTHDGTYITPDSRCAECLLTFSYCLVSLRAGVSM